MQLQAASASKQLAEGSQQNRDDIIASGAVPLLTALSESDLDESESLAASLVQFVAAEVVTLLVLW